MLVVVISPDVGYRYSRTVMLARRMFSIVETDESSARQYIYVPAFKKKAVAVLLLLRIPCCNTGLKSLVFGVAHNGA